MSARAVAVNVATADITSIRITHPNGGISDIAIGVSEDGRLDVSIDPSHVNTYVVDIDEDRVAEGGSTEEG